MWLSLYGNLVAFGIFWLLIHTEYFLATNQILNRKERYLVKKIDIISSRLVLIFNVAYDDAMLHNNQFLFCVQNRIADWRKKKINHFRNKSIPIEENCQYFPELYFSSTHRHMLLLLLYIFKPCSYTYNYDAIYVEIQLQCLIVFCYRKMYHSLESFFIQNNAGK